LVRRVLSEFGEYLDGKIFAVWGLSFKPGTDDMRESPALDVIEGLLARGAEVRATDPVALERGRALFGDRVILDQDSYRILEGADGLLLVTEWNEYRFPDFERIRGLLRKPALFDGRNIWNRQLVAGLACRYYGIGAWPILSRRHPGRSLTSVVRAMPCCRQCIIRSCTSWSWARA